MTQEFEQQSIAEGIELFHHQRDLVKSVVIRVTLQDSMHAKRAGANAMVSALLRRGTSTYSSVSQLSKVCDDLYGATLRIGVQKMGNRQLLSLTLRMPAPAFIPQGLRSYRKAVNLLRDLVFDPVMENSLFPEDTFESERAQILHAIAQIKDNRGAYAMMRARQLGLADSPLGTPEFGSVEALEGLSASSTTQAWHRLVDRAPISIHLVGHFDPNKHLAPIAEAFGPHGRSRPLRLPKSKAVEAAPRSRRGSDRIEGEQAHSVGLYTSSLSQSSKEWPALRLANAIFGRDASSRLFRELREGEGLAYSISSTLSPTSGLISTYAGTDAEQSKAVESGTKRILKELQSAGFDEHELEVSRRTLLEETLAQADSLTGRIVRHLAGQMRGEYRSLDFIEQSLREVTSEQVQDALRRLRPLFLYRLGP